MVALVACGNHISGVSAGATRPVATPSAADAVPAPPKGAQTAAGNGDWAAFNYDAARTGVGLKNTGITAANAHTLIRRLVHLDGTVDSAPILLHAIVVRRRTRDVAVMTTSYGRTIALDPGTGKKLWEFAPRDVNKRERTYQITNTTPIADPDRMFVYAATPDGLIRKLRLASGREVRTRHWPARVTLDATHEKLAAALNITGSSLVATTGGYIGDAPPYQGHVVLIDRATGRVKRVWNAACSSRHKLMTPSTCHASDSAIWARAGAVIEPGSRRILVATGNGPFNGATNWGDSVLELSRDARRVLHNWTPTNQQALEASDKDVGSTAPALLPKTNGRRLIVQGGKDGHLDLLDLDRLNGTRGGAGPRLGGQLQEIATPGSDQMFTAPVVWTNGKITYLFVADNSGTSAYSLVGGGHPQLRVAWQSSTPGTSPVLAGGMLYVYDEKSAHLVIRQPVGGQIVATLPANPGHWNSPIVAGGRVILPEGNANDHATSGTVDIYHLPGR